MMPPFSPRHSQTRSRNFSRPRSRRVFFSLRSSRSTTVWVAMPGVVQCPGIQRAELALQPGAADEDVLDRVVEDMADRQDARHVGRRHDDRIGSRGPGSGLPANAPGRQPRGVPLLFDLARLVALGDLGMWKSTANRAAPAGRQVHGAPGSGQFWNRNRKWEGNAMSFRSWQRRLNGRSQLRAKSPLGGPRSATLTSRLLRWSSCWLANTRLQGASLGSARGAL